MLRYDGLEVTLGPCTLGPWDLAVERGGITALIAPNASGKTTLLRAIAGVLAAAGHATCDGQPLTAARCAYVPQRVRSDVPLTVRRVIELGRLTLPAQADRIDSAMAQFGLADLATRPVCDLSVGQRQRVHLARAMAQVDADGMLLLDEPTAPLDPDWTARTWAALRAFATGGGMVLSSVHDLAAASVAATWVWVLHRDGRLERGPSAQMLNAAQLEALYGVPYCDGHPPMPSWMTHEPPTA